MEKYFLLQGLRRKIGPAELILSFTAHYCMKPIKALQGIIWGTSV